MSFNDDAQLDSGRIRDSRGRGRGGKIAAGGGGIIVVLIAALLGINPDMLTQLGLGGDPGIEQGPGETGPSAISECKTGADANARTDCRILATTQSLDSFWLNYLPQYDVAVQRPGVEVFDGQVSTECGTATSAVGPFYCPADRVAYFDTGFFADLSTNYGADGGPLAEEYVVAHEYGHHIQNTIGTLAASQQGGTGATSGAVRVELQADCFAGMWAAHAANTKDANGNTFMDPFTEADLKSALSAASAVGDDRIQEAATGRVNPEGWTHGSSAQRQAWFLQGYSTGDINQCDTLSARSLDKPGA
ncbi:neutral zinc metallopeptidase [Paeniglutamicibacter sp. ABSL32-1]|uniref:KPN_02809 family neutral zinc metallopeptidase n=1 Tax=Paeniglutamicibacter quisquiliarum TaxID=2849498 RepID=UPI001C2D46F3|nr:neutral zinc metallopeptidase [Paeniglutamicibacter quisquiliarum]MBV1778261.1 neutral zinc metallopeptidase [Paeniglutamicibacter quisquiliarum]